MRTQGKYIGPVRFVAKGRNKLISPYFPMARSYIEQAISLHRNERMFRHSFRSHNNIIFTIIHSFRLSGHRDITCWIDLDKMGLGGIRSLVAVLKSSSLNPPYFNNIFDWGRGTYDYIPILPGEEREKGKFEISPDQNKSSQLYNGNPFLRLGSITWVEQKTGAAVSAIYRSWNTEYRFGQNVDAEQNTKICGLGHQVICKEFVQGLVVNGPNAIGQLGIGGGVHIKKDEDGVRWVIGYTYNFLNWNTGTLKITKGKLPYDTNYKEDQVYPLPSFSFVDQWTKNIPAGLNARVPSTPILQGANFVTNRDGTKTIFFIEFGYWEADRRYEVYEINDTTADGTMSVNKLRTIGPGYDRSTVNYGTVSHSGTSTPSGSRNWSGCSTGEFATSPCRAYTSNNSRLGNESAGTDTGSGTYKVVNKRKNLLGVAYSRITDNRLYAIRDEDFEYTTSYSWSVDKKSSSYNIGQATLFFSETKSTNNKSGNATITGGTSGNTYVVEGSTTLFPPTPNTTNETLRYSENIRDDTFVDAEEPGVLNYDGVTTETATIDRTTKTASFRLVDLSMELYLVTIEEYKSSGTASTYKSRYGLSSDYNITPSNGVKNKLTRKTYFCAEGKQRVILDSTTESTGGTTSFDIGNFNRAGAITYGSPEVKNIPIGSYSCGDTTGDTGECGGLGSSPPPSYGTGFKEWTGDYTVKNGTGEESWYDES
jgi:hypothetical protein